MRERLVRGFTLHERRLAERGLREVRETLHLFARTLQSQALVDNTGQAVLELITGYADMWRLLLEYDGERLTAPPGTKPAAGALDPDRAVLVIPFNVEDVAAENQQGRLVGNC